MQETQILSDFHKMLLKNVEQLKAEEPKVNVKWLAFFCKKLPFYFSAILNAYSDMLWCPFEKFMP